MIVFSSRTGNVRSIVRKLELPSSEISSNLVVNKPYFLITYTDGLGDTPKRVDDFLLHEVNQSNIRGVVASGNTNFGMNFCMCVDEISERFNIPIIRKIDLRGVQADINEIKQKYYQLIGCEI